MEKNNGLKKYENCILTLFVTAVNILLMGICFDFYYDLNDDTMMLDIMSGIYSGTPAGHNMQTLYPLGALIALGYRLCDKVPWYGLFLLLCQFGCFYLAGVRLCVLTEGVWPADREKKRIPGIFRKGLMLSVLSFFLWGSCLSHLVNIQYTITSAVLSATAIFLFLTTPDHLDQPPGQFVFRSLPSIGLALLSYQLRSEMMLLTLPFIGLAGLYRLAGEKRIFVKENLLKYGGVLGSILAGLLLSSGIDRAAYGSAEWKDFVTFFEARTTVYDFYPELIQEDIYQETLTQLGVTQVQQTLLRNYNYGLDDTIDTKLLMKAADYAKEVLCEAKDWEVIARKQFYRYYHRIFRGGDAPYSTILLWMYAAIFVAGCYHCVTERMERKPHRQETGRRRRFDLLWQIVLLIVMRSAVWMFILLRERDPERITHSLYLVEFSLLAAMMMRMLVKKQPVCQRVRGVDGAFSGSIFFSPVLRTIAGAMLFLILANGLRNGVSALREDQEQRRCVNGDWYAIDAYCKAHQENFYFEDVYSTVGFSRKIFGVSDCGYANYDILGGWMCGSPLYHEKIARYGIGSVTQALPGQENVYLIVSDQEAEAQGWEWIENFYAAQEIRIIVEKVDKIGEGYGVYRVTEQRDDEDRS